MIKKTRRPKRKLGMLRLSVAASGVVTTLLGSNWLAQQEAVTLAETVPTAVPTVTQPIPTPSLPPIPTAVAPSYDGIAVVVTGENGRFAPSSAAIPTIIAPSLRQLDVDTGAQGSFSLDLPPIPAVEVPVITQPVTSSKSSK